MEITCIMCPVGCNLTITKNGDEIKVEGNSCPRGHEYGIKETTHPERIITTVKKYSKGTICLKSNKPVPKEMVDKCSIEIKNIKVPHKIKLGEVLIKDILNTGSDIVVTEINK